MIELLTVIAILGVLAGLLLPVLGKVRAKGRAVACMANMRQLGVAIILFTADHDGTLPQSDDTEPSNNAWFYAIDPYLSNGTVPESRTLAQKLMLIKQDPIWKTFDEKTRANGRTIKMNRKLHGKTTGFTSASSDKIKDAQPPCRKKLSITDSANTVLLFDGRCEGGDPIHQQWYDGWEAYVARRHSDGANVVFVDGHGEWRHETPHPSGKGWKSDDPNSTLKWWGTN